MSAMRSPATENVYGIERVCSAWEQPRSTYYWHVVKASGPTESSAPKRKRGPKTDVSDDGVLAAIRKAIEDSPFEGEGYRKIWACLGENELLSPYRGRKADPNDHDRSITTDAPNEMWGTDGTQARSQKLQPSPPPPLPLSLPGRVEANSSWAACV